MEIKLIWSLTKAAELTPRVGESHSAGKPRWLSPAATPPSDGGAGTAPDQAGAHPRERPSETGAGDARHLSLLSMRRRGGNKILINSTSFCRDEGAWEDNLTYKPPWTSKEDEAGVKLWTRVGFDTGAREWTLPSESPFSGSRFHRTLSPSRVARRLPPPPAWRITHRREERHQLVLHPLMKRRCWHPKRGGFPVRGPPASASPPRRAAVATQRPLLAPGPTARPGQPVPPHPRPVPAGWQQRRAHPPHTGPGNSESNALPTPPPPPAGVFFWS